jgi:hypothetical protein
MDPDEDPVFDGIFQKCKGIGTRTFSKFIWASWLLLLLLLLLLLCCFY